MTTKAKKVLESVRRRPNAPHKLPLTPVKIYKIIAVGLYQEQIEYLDTLSDALKRHKNEPRNRSGAVQWLIEEHMKQSSKE